MADEPVEDDGKRDGVPTQGHLGGGVADAGVGEIRGGRDDFVEPQGRPVEIPRHQSGVRIAELRRELGLSSLR
jgi:hypothetical protein